MAEIVKILIIDTIANAIEVYSSQCPCEIVYLEETIDLDADINKDGSNYYVKTHIPWREVSAMTSGIELVAKAKEHAKKTEIGELQDEYEELSSKLAQIEGKISENLEKQTKIERGED
jgi:hypothetical protein